MGMTLDKYLKETNTVLITQDAFVEMKNTMRKYQKIQEIINNTDYIQEDVIRYKMICGVMNNDQISKSTSK